MIEGRQAENSRHILADIQRRFGNMAPALPNEPKMADPIRRTTGIGDSYLEFNEAETEKNIAEAERIAIKTTPGSARRCGDGNCKSCRPGARMPLWNTSISSPAFRKEETPFGAPIPVVPKVRWGRVLSCILKGLNDSWKGITCI